MRNDTIALLTLLIPSRAKPFSMFYSLVLGQNNLWTLFCKSFLYSFGIFRGAVIIFMGSCFTQPTVGRLFCGHKFYVNLLRRCHVRKVIIFVGSFRLNNFNDLNIGFQFVPIPIFFSYFYTESCFASVSLLFTMLTSISTCVYSIFCSDTIYLDTVRLSHHHVLFPVFLQGKEKKKSTNLLQTILCCTYFYYKSKADDEVEILVGEENSYRLNVNDLQLCHIPSAFYKHSPFTYFPFYCSLILHICIFFSTSQCLLCVINVISYYSILRCSIHTGMLIQKCLYVNSNNLNLFFIVIIFINIQFKYIVVFYLSFFAKHVCILRRASLAVSTNYIFLHFNADCKILCSCGNLSSNCYGNFVSLNLKA